LLACWLMWNEAGLPPKNRPLHLFGGDSRKFVTEIPYPESCIAFGGGIYVITILSVLGLIGREDNSPEWHWGPAFIGVGVFLVLLMHQARRVNGTDMAVVQPGHILGLLAGAGLLAAGGIVLVASCRTASRDEKPTI
jgi:hypothetical protein